MVGTKMIAVTGGNGRIGRKLVQALLKQGQEVMVLDININPSLEGVKQIESDLSDLEKLTYSLSGVTVVYHLAAVIDYQATKDELIKKNVETTKNILNAVLKNRVKQFVFMSTTSVYGESKKGEPFDESSEAKPYSNYGWSKLKCEEAIIESGTPYTIIRSSQVFGPQFKEGYTTAFKYLKQGKMRIFGNGKNIVPMVHISDLVSALLLVKDNPKALNKIFNVDGGYNKTQKEFLTIASNVLSVQPPTSHITPEIAKAFSKFAGKQKGLDEYIDKLSKNRPISIENIKNTGYKPKADLEKSIKEVASAFKERGLI